MSRPFSGYIRKGGTGRLLDPNGNIGARWMVVA